jgi:hypothetical protein
MCTPCRRLVWPLVLRQLWADQASVKSSRAFRSVRGALRCDLCAFRRGPTAPTKDPNRCGPGQAPRSPEWRAWPPALSSKLRFGWGSWIRTTIDGVRVRCSTVELSPARSPQKGVQRRALALLPDGGSLHSAGQCREHGATQGNRVKDSCCNETCEGVVVPCGSFEVPQSDRV